MEISKAICQPLSFAAPVAQTERLAIIDSLRGFAILGIFLMNIVAFGMPHVAGGDPSMLKETGINYYIWYFIDGVIGGTQRALFSLLFGAGIVLFLSRLEKSTEGMVAAQHFFRRQLWLLLFGLADVYILLWQYDILYNYALYGMLLFAFRPLSPKPLFIASLVCLAICTARENRNFYQDKAIINNGERVAKIDTTTIKLDLFQHEALDKMKEFERRSSKEEKHKELEKEVLLTRGGFADIYKTRAEGIGFWEETFGVYYGLWGTLSFMFLGMAFYKTGVITGQRPVKLYLLLFVIGSGVGAVLCYYMMHPFIKYNFDGYAFTKNTSFVFFEISRFFRSLGVFGLIMLLYKSGRFSWLFNLMRPVGQMAFTNYLVQSIIGGIIFYGIGFAMFGKLQRYELYYVVGAVWVSQAVFSHIWLRHFRFGPFEWLWRSLTYWKAQPMKR